MFIKSDELMELPPINTRYKLGPKITDEQLAFLEAYGFVHFEGVASRDEVQGIISELDRIESEWVLEKRSSINGIPLFWGKDDKGKKFLQRFAFTSRHSNFISEFVRHDRFEPIRLLVGEDARIGEDEKDGVVVNRYMNVPESIHPRLGWHTDGLRDLCYLRMPQRMLNIGLHLDDCDTYNGGLRLIPGTHRQNFMSMCFKKPYFIDHRSDDEEICVTTKAGDLTIHDGRLWHRVARSKLYGQDSLRRTMFVPYLTGPYEPKSSGSKTPIYHHIGVAMRAAKSMIKQVMTRRDRLIQGE